MQEYVVDAGDAGLRLDQWLVRRGGAPSRAKASTWLERGKVFVNGEEAGLADGARRVAAGDRVGVWIDRPGSAKPADRAIAGARARLDILHEDSAIVVVDKPVGLIVEPLPDEGPGEPTVLDLLEDHYRHEARARVYVVHRIDRDTSGLVLFARTPSARDALKDQFEQRTPERVYQAIVVGVMPEDAATWSDYLAWDKAALRQRRAHGTDAGAKEAIANVRVVERFAQASLIEVSLVTGKRNQIRVQAAIRGFPLLGERQYRFDAPDEPEGLPRMERQALHAARLGFVHPSTKKRVSYAAPLPEDLSRVLQALRRHGQRRAALPRRP
jgi:23S rRNA pseudouridine1911/1915/1917 synthase